MLSEESTDEQNGDERQQKDGALGSTMAPKAFADALLRGEGVICTRGTRVERVCIEPVAKLGRRGLLLPSGQPSPALAERGVWYVMGTMHGLDHLACIGWTVVWDAPRFFADHVAMLDRAHGHKAQAQPMQGSQASSAQVPARVSAGESCERSHSSVLTGLLMGLSGAGTGAKPLQGDTGFACAHGSVECGRLS